MKLLIMSIILTLTMAYNVIAEEVPCKWDIECSDGHGECRRKSPSTKEMICYGGDYGNTINNPSYGQAIDPRLVKNCSSDDDCYAGDMCNHRVDGPRWCVAKFSPSPLK